MDIRKINTGNEEKQLLPQSFPFSILLSSVGVLFGLRKNGLFNVLTYFEQDVFLKRLRETSSSKYIRRLQGQRTQRDRRVLREYFLFFVFNICFPSPCGQHGAKA